MKAAGTQDGEAATVRPMADIGTTAGAAISAGAHMEDTFTNGRSVTIAGVPITATGAAGITEEGLCLTTGIRKGIINKMARQAATFFTNLPRFHRNPAA